MRDDTKTPFNKSTDVQTVLIPKDLCTLAQAKAWLRHAGFKYGKVDLGSENAAMYRFRQHEPSDYRPSTFRTIALGSDGSKAVIGVTKRGVAGPRIITVKRAGYVRKAYTPASGVRVSKTRVPPTKFKE